MKKMALLLLISFVPAIYVNAQAVGDPAPDFSYDDYEGNNFTLSDHKGKVVFIFTFGNTCPSCLGFGNKTETEINDVYGSREDFVAVGLDTWNSSSTNSSVEQFAGQTGITYPLLVKAGDMAVDYQTTYDRLLVVDKDGILRHKGTTLASNDLNNAKAVINEYINQTPTSVSEISGLNTEIFPIPAKDAVNMAFHLDKEAYIEIKIFNTAGVQMKSGYQGILNAGENRISILTSAFPEGIYFYRMNVEGSENVAGKFIIKK